MRKTLAVLVCLTACTEPALNRYSKLLDRRIGNSSKKEMNELLGPPVHCKTEFNDENCEYRTARGRNLQVPAVHQQNQSMGPDLSPYEHFDVLLLQFDSLGILQNWKPHTVK